MHIIRFSMRAQTEKSLSWAPTLHLIPHLIFTIFYYDSMPHLPHRLLHEASLRFRHLNHLRSYSDMDYCWWGQRVNYHFNVLWNIVIFFILSNSIEDENIFSLQETALKKKKTSWEFLRCHSQELDIWPRIFREFWTCKRVLTWACSLNTSL